MPPVSAMRKGRQGGGGAVDDAAGMDGGAGHPTRDRRGQRVGAAGARSIHHRQDAALFRHIGAGLAQHGAGLVRAGAGDDAFAFQLRQAAGARLRYAQPCARAIEVRAHGQYIAAGDDRQRLAAPHFLALDHQDAGDDAGEGGGDRDTRVGRRRDQRGHDRNRRLGGSDGRAEF